MKLIKHSNKNYVFIIHPLNYVEINQVTESNFKLYFQKLRGHLFRSGHLNFQGGFDSHEGNSLFWILKVPYFKIFTCGRLLLGGAQRKLNFSNLNKTGIKIIFLMKAFKQDQFYYPIDQK